MRGVRVFVLVSKLRLESGDTQFSKVKRTSGGISAVRQTKKGSVSAMIFGFGPCSRADLVCADVSLGTPRKECAIE